MAIFFNAFAEIYNANEKRFFTSYKETMSLTTFRYSYRGPYIRNPVTDSVNEYNTQKTFKVKFLQYMFYMIFLSFLGLNVALYYGCRMLMIAVSPYINEELALNTYFFHPLHLVGYGLFFVVNSIIYPVLIKPLANFLTRF